VDFMKVKEIMTKEVICVSKNDNLRYVIDTMEKHNITKIPVLDNGKIVGVVTDNKMADKLGSIKSKGIPAARMHASTIMEKLFVKLTPDTEISSILTTVGKPGLTMLLVCDNDTLAGVITKHDLLALVKGTTPVGDIMTKEVHSVRPSDRIIHARRLLIDNDIARIPVIDNGKVVGMLSDREIAFAFADLKKSYSIGHQHHRLRELLVKDVMKAPALTIKIDTSTEDAAKTLLKHEIGCLPVVDEKEKLAGMVTRTDLVRLI
jgi:CBS domain-containing protein